VSRLTELGWRPQITLDDGIRSTYEWFLTQTGSQRGLRGMELAEADA
jgi:GDP-L-fucose synthase